MRIDVKKFLFLGPLEQRKLFFRRAQELGMIEFIDQSEQRNLELPENIRKYNQAMKILRGLAPIEQAEYSNLNTALPTADKIIDLNSELELRKEEKRVIIQEIHRVAVFGDFLIDDIDHIEKQGHRKIQFFFSKKAQLIEASKRPEVIHIGSDHDLDYFITINSEPKKYEGMVEMIIDKPHQVLIKRRDELIDKMHDLEAELKQLRAFKTLLKEAAVYTLNVYNLHVNQKYIEPLFDNNLFSIQGWIADSNIAQVKKLIASFSIIMEEIAIERTDKIPTHLVNHGLGRVGEDLVHIYDTPSTTDKDPSKWVLWFFSLFFAIIVGDGGYGAIFLVLALFTRVKFPHMADHGKRFVKLLTTLALSCIIWGFLTASCFGINFSLKGNVREFSPFTWLVEQKTAYHMLNQDDVYNVWLKKFPQLANIRVPYEFLTTGVIEKDGSHVFIIFDSFADSILLELSLFIGVIHICIGLIRNLKKNRAGIGWILFLVGGYLFSPSVLKATSLIHWFFGVPREGGAYFGGQILYVGIIVACVLAVIQKRIKGLGEIMRVIEVFADVLSYLRLYALALAGSIMASTFNVLGAKAGFFIGIVIILIGHSVNITLSIMGGVIHGLRLNFLEWYHYCFDGGGRLHKPLALLKLRK